MGDPAAGLTIDGVSLGTRGGAVSVSDTLDPVEHDQKLQWCATHRS